MPSSSASADTSAIFAHAYNASAGLRDAVYKALMDIGAGLEEYETPTTWEECLACLDDCMESNVHVEMVQGLPGEHAMLYPLATYGWDGGNAIGSASVNLTELVYVHVAGGPCATLVRRTDPSYPGLALHYAEGEESLTVQLF